MSGRFEARLTEASNTTRLCRHYQPRIGGAADSFSRFMERAWKASASAVLSRKPGLYVVAPTNRRPYGFDWEDWGRQDAIEVLDLAQKVLDTDREHTYLTGHSMGGHGTWHLGVTFPDRFAAIAPSAGWISMWSYAGARRADSSSLVEELMGRAMGASDTLALSQNLSGLGVYILHGDADDNVPVGQARQMRKLLGEFHPDFAYHEQPGAGHWWGNECVDWPPLVEFLTAHKIPKSSEVRRIDFVTASPAVSSRADQGGDRGPAETAFAQQGAY